MRHVKRGGWKTGALVGALVLLAGCGGTRNLAGFQPPPDKAIVLFDGKDFSHWVTESGGPASWKLVEGRAMEVVCRTKEDFPGGKKPSKVGIQTKRTFRDFTLHVEFLVPPGENDNSGVYLQRRYEIQIADSSGGKEHKNGCGAIYTQKQPDVNVCRKPGEWQSYDIVFQASRWGEKDGKPQKVQNARIGVVHNGVLIHNDVEILNKTGAGDPESADPAPILLQDHGSLTRFRNVWIVPNGV